jgi:hypothetical protein
MVWIHSVAGEIIDFRNNYNHDAIPLSGYFFKKKLFIVVGIKNETYIRP